jgi:hypothetical protein
MPTQIYQAGCECFNPPAGLIQPMDLGRRMASPAAAETAEPQAEQPGNRAARSPREA